MSSSLIAAHNVSSMLCSRERTPGQLEYLIVGYKKEMTQTTKGWPVPALGHAFTDHDDDNKMLLGVPHGRERLEEEEPIMDTIYNIVTHHTGGGKLEAPFNTLTWQETTFEGNPVRWLTFICENISGQMDRKDYHMYYAWHTKEELEAMMADASNEWTTGFKMIWENHLNKAPEAAAE